MERRHSDSTQHQEPDQRAVAGREPDRAQEHGRHQRPERHEPRAIDAIREPAKQRLRERRRERGESDQRADEREAEMELRHQQRQERREEARVRIDREVAERDEDETRREHLAHGDSETSTGT